MQAATQQESLTPTRTLSMWVKMMYGMGEIANSIKVVTFGLFSMFFVTVVMGLPGVWVGIIGFITVLWDALIDPILGFLTDSGGASRRRFGFMLTGALTMGIGYWAFFDPPKGLPMVPLFAWLLVANLILRTANSMYIVPYYALGANLSRDYHERTSITAIRGIMSTIGTAVAAALSFVVFFPEKAPGVDPKIERSGYASMGVTFAVVMTVVALLAMMGANSLRHKSQTPPDSVQPPRPDFFKSMWESLRNPTFRVLLLSCVCIVVGLTLNGTLMLHFLTYYVEIKGSVALSSAQIAFFSGCLLGTLFWLRISKKMDKHFICLIAAIATSALLLSAWPMFGKGHPFGTGDIRPILLGYGVTGFFSCILAFVPPSMLADVADESELTIGDRREGALFGIFSLGQQAAVGVGIMLGGALLDQFARLIPGKAQQSELTVSRIGVIYSVFPAVLLGIAAILMLKYKLSRSRVESIQAQLHQRRSMQAVAGRT